MRGISIDHGQGPVLKNLDIFDEMYDLYCQKNHGMNIWKESGILVEKHIDDAVIRHFLTPCHDFAVFYRMISALQLRISPDDVSELTIDCLDSGLDFQVIRQAYCKHKVR